MNNGTRTAHNSLRHVMGKCYTTGHSAYIMMYHYVPQAALQQLPGQPLT